MWLVGRIIFKLLTLISKVKKEAVYSAHRLMGADLAEMILYGSCARGDYGKDSDIDIALLTKCGRMEAKNMMTAWTQ